MKNFINKLGWCGLLLALLTCFTITSCKKEDDKIVVTPTPIVTSTTTHYTLISSRQYDEASEIWVYNDGSTNKISVPILSAYPDTLNTTFNQQVNVLPLRVQGGINIISDTLKLNYNEWNLPSNTFVCNVVNAIYIQD